MAEVPAVPAQRPEDWAEHARQQRRADVVARAQRLARQAERHGLRLRLRLARAM